MIGHGPELTATGTSIYDKLERAWFSTTMPLGERCRLVSKYFYEAHLDLGRTAALLKTTPAEFEAMLLLGALDETSLNHISAANPPKTTWLLLSEAEPEEVIVALGALESRDIAEDPSTCVYQAIKDYSGPSLCERVASLSPDTLQHMHKKGLEYGALDEFCAKFLSSVAHQRKCGKVLTEKQSKKLTEILQMLVNKRVVLADSADGDQDYCNEVLKSLGHI